MNLKFVYGCRRPCPRHVEEGRIPPALSAARRRKWILWATIAPIKQKLLLKANQIMFQKLRMDA